jgi:hypothetical protein
MKGMVMNYEVAEGANHGDWVVESIGSDGEVYVALFSGPLAEERAREYALLKGTAKL